MNPRNPHPPGHSAPPSGQPGPLKVGRYTFFGEIASGGMASVYLGRMSGQAGFSKTVAIKRPHPHLASNPEFARMIVDEARLAARIQHPNVVATLDVVANNGELFLVMDYVHGESLWHLLAAANSRGIRTPPAIAGAIVVNVLHGLHAAHEATDELGQPLDIVHRDVSPQNVLVGVDGVARVLDFGVAKATGRLQSTHEGQLKGKFAYMAPEQVSGAPIDRRTDIYAAAALLWGALAGRRLIEGRSEAELLNNVLQCKHLFPSSYAPGITPHMDQVVMQGLMKHPEDRYQTARDMAVAVESAFGTLSPYEVGEWVKSLASEAIDMRAAHIREMESAADVRVSMNMGVAEIVQGGTYGTYDVHAPPPVNPHAATGQTALMQAHVHAHAHAHAQSQSQSPSYSQPGSHPGSHSGSHPHPHHGPTTAGLSYVNPHAAVDHQHDPRRSLASLVGVAALVFAVTFGGTLYWRYGPSRGTPTGTTTGAGVADPTPTTSQTQIGEPPPPPLPPTTGIVTVTTTTPPVTGLPAGTAAVPSAHGTSATTPPSGKTNSTTTPKVPVKPPGPGPGPKKPPKSDCESSPFFVDGEGIKRVRPECS